ncbi:MAG: universal stress protein [Nitrospiraceae bacterium]|nr:universal stress protein [Nitrospiraceae bacterium]
MYKTLLVGFDDSQPSKAALTEAANWVRRHGGEIILVHAVYFDSEEFGISPNHMEKRLKHGEKVCLETKEMISREFGVETKSVLCEGEPPEVLVTMAKEKKADLVVLGTFGRRGINRLLMGSVTSQVIVNSPVDVLVVKKPCSDCSGSYRSILVPFDGSEFSVKALDRACSLSGTDGVEITVLYVIPRYEELLGFFRTDSIKKSMNQEAQKIVDAAVAAASAKGVSVKTEVKEGHSAEKIIETAAGLKKDLIVMGSYGWRGVNKAIMGSTTERVLIGAPCPVLAVR